MKRRSHVAWSWKEFARIIMVLAMASIIAFFFLKMLAVWIEGMAELIASQELHDAAHAISSREWMILGFLLAILTLVLIVVRPLSPGVEERP